MSWPSLMMLTGGLMLIYSRELSLLFDRDFFVASSRSLRSAYRDPVDKPLPPVLADLAASIDNPRKGVVE